MTNQIKVNKRWFSQNKIFQKLKFILNGEFPIPIYLFLSNRIDHP